MNTRAKTCDITGRTIVMHIATLVFVSTLFVTSGAWADDFASDWQGTRTWLGPQFWANRLQDWRLENGVAIALAANRRNAHITTVWVDANAPFELQTEVALGGQPAGNGSAVWAGFQLGMKPPLNDRRSLLVPRVNVRAVRAGVRANGVLFIENQLVREPRLRHRPLLLTLTCQPQGRHSLLTLQAKGIGPRGQTLAAVSIELPVSQLSGGLALAVGGPQGDASTRPETGPNQSEVEDVSDDSEADATDEIAADSADDADGALGTRAVNDSRSGNELQWHFQFVKASGDGIKVDPRRTFGPILWTQYLVAHGNLRMNVQLPPLGETDSKSVRLQCQRHGEWSTVATADWEPMSRTALLEAANWRELGDVPYRCLCYWQGKEHVWEGIVRYVDPRRPRMTIGVFSCDHGYAFPLAGTVQQVRRQDPDFVYFAGDQIYEVFGGFGIQRQPLADAMLDYLRKYYQFGWTWRDVLKDRPSVIIPDDHDVFQGNLWGESGAAAVHGQQQGGYLMPPEWVNAVQRTQTAQLPVGPDPAPVSQGIAVYFTSFELGGIPFAVIEDRKFKSSPHALTGHGRAITPAEADLPDAQLLGPRQEAFLSHWSQEHSQSDLRIVLSQTIFAKVHTHAGPNLLPSGLDFDSGGWPQSKRRRALEALRDAPTLMLHGDQHLGVLARHGVRTWEDGPVAFMVPGTANGFPRAWWPEKPGDQPTAAQPESTGRFEDPFGNRVTVLAVANPDRGANRLKLQQAGPDEVALRKGSGYGIVTIDREQHQLKFEMWHHAPDQLPLPQPSQFAGFPVVIPFQP
ncbi:MAG: alkaline phosphatase D family protein [Pirellulaceae bacterium]